MLRRFLCFSRHTIFITSPLSPLLSSSPPLSPRLSLSFRGLISASQSSFSVVVFFSLFWVVAAAVVAPAVAAGAAGAGAGASVCGAAVLLSVGAVFRYFGLCSLSLRSSLSIFQVHASDDHVACM